MIKQNGFLLIVAVIMVTVVGVICVGLSQVFLRITGGAPLLNSMPSTQSLAESGLQQAMHSISLPVLQRTRCAALQSTVSLPTGNAIAMRSNSLANSINPREAFGILTTSIANNTTLTTLTVEDTQPFSSHGRVLIGREVFEYGSILNSVTLNGVRRAQDGSVAAAHDIGEVVSQYQCTIAGVGNETVGAYTLSREYQRGVQQPQVVAVGENGTISTWNNVAAELSWSNQHLGSNLIHGISLLNYHSGWAVSNKQNNSFSVSRLQGNTWQNYALSSNAASDLTGVYATSEQEAWAVGNSNHNQLVMLRWVRNLSNSATNWCQLPCGGITISGLGQGHSTNNLYAIKMVDTNHDGYANVGYAVGGSNTALGLGFVMYYSGQQWRDVSEAPLLYSYPAQLGQLRGLDLTLNTTNNMPNELFFAGMNAVTGLGGIFKLQIVNNLPVWSAVQTIQGMNGIAVLDVNGDGIADVGCAVGDAGLVVLFDDNLVITASTQLTSETLRAVRLVSAKDIWVVGDSGSRFHYDGTQWTALNDAEKNDYYGLDVISMKNSPFSLWYDLIN